jgi:hypothetical protein
MSMKTPFMLLGAMLAGWLAMGSSLHGQSVAVFARLDTNAIPVGGSTVLHIQAQVLSNLRTNADRIFSWYVDVLNTNGVVAGGQYASMTKPASDKDPRTSSFGFDDGANHRGVFDTFLNLPGAGVSNVVELMSIPVSGLSAGRTRFLVHAGSGVPSLSQDFIVAPIGGGDPYTGGDYSAAFGDLTVSGGCDLRLSLTRLSGSGPTAAWSLGFTPCPGFTHTVESTDQPGLGAVWQPLPGAPHNSGSLTVSNVVTARFFRVRAVRP